MKQPLTILSFFIAIILMSACTQSSINKAGLEMQPSAKVASDESSTSAKATKQETIERKLIKEGRIVFETDNIEATQQKVLKAVETYDGYIALDEMNKWKDRKNSTLVIRVPAKHFDLLINEVTKGVEQFKNKQIEVKDVTEEFVDVEVRLKTKKELETRYLELLQKAKTVTEMLEIEKQIGKLRSEIESVEGRLQYLQSQIDYATLNLTFFEQVPLDNKFVKRFKNGFKNGLENLIWFFVGLVNVWPFLLIGITLFWGIRRYTRKQKT